jgi:hypothetical protein
MQLFDHFARTRAIRRSIIDWVRTKGQDDDRPDFGRSDHPEWPLRPKWRRSASAAMRRTFRSCRALRSAELLEQVVSVSRIS